MSTLHDEVSSSEALNLVLEARQHLKEETVEQKCTQVSGSQPYLIITEQPQSRGFRFRYKCEGPSHGGIPGVDSVRGRKSYPTVKIMNYNGPARIMVMLVTEDTHKIHAHELVGRHCRNGICMMELKGGDMKAMFPNLGVMHTTKRNLQQELEERILESMKCEFIIQYSELDENYEPSSSDIAVARETAVKLAKSMPLSSVRLCFTAYLEDEQGRFTRALDPVVSEPIYDNKSPGSTTLKICRMDKYGCCCTGNDEVFLLCEKVQKDDINVLFIERDENGSVVWEAIGNFGPNDVHRQYAIVFRTPPYHNTHITEAVQVMIQLKRQSDGQVSEPKVFTYFPQQIDREGLTSKRKKPLPPRLSRFDDPQIDPRGDLNQTPNQNGGPGAGGAGLNSSWHPGRAPSESSSHRRNMKKLNSSKQSSKMDRNIAYHPPSKMNTASVCNYAATLNDISVSNIPSTISSPSFAATFNHVSPTMNDVRSSPDLTIGSATKIRNVRNNVPAAMNGLSSEMNGISSEMNGLSSEMNGISSEMNGISSEMNGMSSEMNSVSVSNLIAAMNAVSGPEGHNLINTASTPHVPSLINMVSPCTVQAFLSDVTLPSSNIFAPSNIQQIISDTLQLPTIPVSNKQANIPTSNLQTNKSSGSSLLNKTQTYSNQQQSFNVKPSLATNNAVYATINPEDIKTIHNNLDNLSRLCTTVSPKVEVISPACKDIPISLDSFENIDYLDWPFDVELNKNAIDITMANENSVVPPNLMDSCNFDNDLLLDITNIDQFATHAVNKMDFSERYENGMGAFPQITLYANATDGGLPISDANDTAEECDVTSSTDFYEDSDSRPNPPVTVGGISSSPQSRTAETLETDVDLLTKNILPDSTNDDGDISGSDMGAVTEGNVMGMATRLTAALWHYAATADVKHLLLAQRHLLLQADDNADTVIHIAVIHEQEWLLRQILFVLSTFPSNGENLINSYNALHQTPLHIAVLTHQHDIAELLLQQGADPNLTDHHGNTVGHMAAASGDAEFLELLSNSSHSKYESDHTSGHNSGHQSGHQSGHLSGHRHFLDLEAFNDDGVTALHLAVIVGSLPCVKALVDAGATTDCDDRKSGRTALHYAADYSDLTIAGYLLLEAAADVNAVTYDGNTALHIACGHQSPAMVALLMASGANPDLENDECLDRDYCPSDGESDPLEMCDVHWHGYRPVDLSRGHVKIKKILDGEPYTSLERVDVPSRSQTSSSANLDDTMMSLAHLNLNPPVTSELSLLNHKTRVKLSRLLDARRAGGDWRRLCRVLGLDAGYDAFAEAKSPTRALLDHYEACGGRIADLRQALSAINRSDALSVLDDIPKPPTWPHTSVHSGTHKYSTRCPPSSSDSRISSSL